MPDDNSLLLQTILHEQRATRDDVSDLNKSMATKEDLNDYRLEMKNNFDDLHDKVDEHGKTIVELKSSENLNTNFRKGFINGVKYVGGAVFVALLGIASAIAPSYLTHQNNGAVVAAPATITTPHEVKLHISVPHGHNTEEENP
jgi:hypothetical protein